MIVARSAVVFSLLTAELKEGFHLSKPKDTHKFLSQVKILDKHLATSIVTLETRPHLSTITQEFDTFKEFSRLALFTQKFGYTKLVVHLRFFFVPTMDMNMIINNIFW